VRFLRDEKGSVVLIATVLLSVSLLLLAMIVDLGTVWLVKARLQTAADAATLAAVGRAVIVTQETIKTLHLDDFEAQIEARTVFDLNSWREVAKGVVITWLVADSGSLGADAVTYHIKVRAQVPATVLTPLMSMAAGESQLRVFEFQVESESEAFVQIP
jgi:Flp pilus assembly protein TadG